MMQIIGLSKEEYKKLDIKYFSCFDTVDFVELNSKKVDSVKYFVFNNGKNRFALVAGLVVVDGKRVLKLPFSATFCCFSEITKDNRIEHYHDAVKVLCEWAITNDVSKIIFSLPPVFYDELHITKLSNALFCNGFSIKDYDVNFQYNLEKFDENYVSKLQIHPRQKLKNALKQNLSFEKTDDIETVYEIIKTNRKERGFPLWMSCDDLRKTCAVIESDFFLVRDCEKNPVASAYVQHITEKVVNVVYWGNLGSAESLRPMNFLAYKIFEYYAQLSHISAVKFVSIGISTENSVPNFGLCDFKESIGCDVSAKIIFEWGSDI